MITIYANNSKKSADLITAFVKGKQSVAIERCIIKNGALAVKHRIKGVPFVSVDGTFMNEKEAYAWLGGVKK